MAKTPTPILDVGQCIYCESADNLGDEHIIPLSLGGPIVLKDASCADCAKITMKFEQRCARTIFGPMRIFFNIKTRKKSQRPNELEMLVRFGSDQRAINVPLHMYPIVSLRLPVFRPAGIRSGKPKSDQVDLVHAHIEYIDEKREKRLMNYLYSIGASDPQVRYKFDLNAYMRLLAKIAHGVAVGQYGLHNFEPLLPDYILGRDDCLGHVVGCPESEVSKKEPVVFGPRHGNASHHLSNGFLRIQGEPFIGCHIQLFSQLRFPVYEVIVGRPSPHLLHRLASQSGASQGR